MSEEFLVPIFAKIRDNIDAWLERYSDSEGSSLSAREMREHFAYLNAAIARRLPVQGEVA